MRKGALSTLSKLSNHGQRAAIGAGGRLPRATLISICRQAASSCRLSTIPTTKKRVPCWPTVSPIVISCRSTRWISCRAAVASTASRNRNQRHEIVEGELCCGDDGSDLGDTGNAYGCNSNVPWKYADVFYVCWLDE